MFEILHRTYGHIRWYKNLMEGIAEDMKKYLLRNTPCTSIWWSRERCHSNVHVDSDAYGASFLFVPRRYKGGAITFWHRSVPNKELSYVVPSGTVVAGRWGRSHHYNKPFRGVRNSFVMYADYRIVNRTGDRYLDLSDGLMEYYNTAIANNRKKR